MLHCEVLQLPHSTGCGYGWCSMPGIGGGCVCVCVCVCIEVGKMAKDIGMTAVLHDYIVLQSSLNDIFVVNRMDLTIAIQVLKGTVSFALSLELGKTRAGSSLSKYKSQVKINSQQLQPKQMTASIATAFTTQ